MMTNTVVGRVFVTLIHCYVVGVITRRKTREDRRRDARGCHTILSTYHLRPECDRDKKVTTEFYCRQPLTRGRKNMSSTTTRVCLAVPMELETMDVDADAQDTRTAPPQNNKRGRDTVGQEDTAAHDEVSPKKKRKTVSTSPNNISPPALTLAKKAVVTPKQAKVESTPTKQMSARCDDELPVASKVIAISMDREIARPPPHPASHTSIAPAFEQQVSISKEHAHDHRVPPLQLASFASETSTVGSMEEQDIDEQEDKDETTDKLPLVARPKRGAYNVRSSFLLLVALLAVAFVSHRYMTTPHFSDNCVKIGGGGFSGFYFMHGILLRHREMVLQRDILCYSAGCLNAVALWSNYSIDQVIDFGRESQFRYTSGQMPWSKATDRMVHNLIHENGLLATAASPGITNSTTLSTTNANDKDDEVSESALQHLVRTNPNFLASLHIITTTFSTWGWPTMVIRSPTTVHELQEMMLQTSWLPFATGDGWVKRGHLDGVFTLLFHPTCRTSIRISQDWQILYNMVNVLMPASVTRELYEKGQRCADELAS